MERIILSFWTSRRDAKNPGYSCIQRIVDTSCIQRLNMSQGVMSPDGNWMWTGSEWIPAPPDNPPRTTDNQVPIREVLLESLEQMNVATLNDDDPFSKAARSSAVGGVLLFFLLIPLMFYLFPWLNPFGTIGIVVSLFFAILVPFVISSKNIDETGLFENIMQVALVAFLVFITYTIYSGI